MTKPRTQAKKVRYAFNYPWELCVEAYHRRYPTHKRVQVLLNSRVVKDEFHDETKIRVIERICSINLEIPKFVLRAMKIENFEFLQITNIDYTKRTMITESRNITLKDTFSILELLSIHADPKRPNWTITELSATLDLPKFPLSGIIQKYISGSYEKNSRKNKDIDLAFIHDVLQEGSWDHLKNRRDTEVVTEPVEEMEEAPTISREGPPPLSKMTTNDLFYLMMGLVIILVLPQIVLSLVHVDSLQSYYLGIMLVTSFIYISHISYPSSSYIAFLSQSDIFMESLAILIDGFISPELFIFSLLMAFGTLVFIPQWFPYSWIKLQSTASYSIGSFLSLLTVTVHIALFKEQYRKLQDFRVGEDKDGSEDEIMPLHQKEENDPLTSPASSIAGREKNMHVHIPEKQHGHSKSSSVASNPVISTGNTTAGEESDGGEEGFLEDEEENQFNDKQKVLNKPLHDALVKIDGSLMSMKISVPAFVNHLVKGKYTLFFVVQLEWVDNEGVVQKMAIRKLYKEIRNLGKSLHALKKLSLLELSSDESEKNFQNFPSINLPSLRRLNPDYELYNACLEYRRATAEKYISQSLELLNCLTGVKGNKAYNLWMDFLVHDLHPQDILDIITCEPTSLVSLSSPGVGTTATSIDKKATVISSSYSPGSSIPSAIANSVPAHHKNPSISTFIRPSLSSYVTLARWRHLWKDYKFILDYSKLGFYEPHSGKDSLECAISLMSIIKVKYMREEGETNFDTLDQRNAPSFTDYFFVKIEVDCKDISEYYLAFKRMDVMSRLIEYLNKHIQNYQLRKDSLSANSSNADMKKPNLSGIRSINPLPGKKAILNKRIFHFPSLSSNFACSLSKCLLEEALDLYQVYSDNNQLFSDPLVHRMIEFGKKTCQLQAISLKELSEQEKLAFYINIYHTLLVHAHLEFGKPSPHSTDTSANSFSLKKLLAAASYEINGYIYNLIDIEHSVLRAATSRPLTSTGSSMIITKWIGSSYNTSITDERLSSKDPRRLNAPLLLGDVRVNFVLCNGSVSSIDHVYVFNPYQIDEQLDHASRHYLLDRIQIKIKEKPSSFYGGHSNIPNGDHMQKRPVLILPILLQWYSRDFEGVREKRHLVKQLIKFMPLSLKDKLIGLGILKDMRAVESGVTPIGGPLSTLTSPSHRHEYSSSSDISIHNQGQDSTLNPSSTSTQAHDESAVSPTSSLICLPLKKDGKTHSRHSSMGKITELFNPFHRKKNSKGGIKDIDDTTVGATDYKPANANGKIPEEGKMPYMVNNTKAPSNLVSLPTGFAGPDNNNTVEAHTPSVPTITKVDGYVGEQSSLGSTGSNSEASSINISSPSAFDHINGLSRDESPATLTPLERQDNGSRANSINGGITFKAPSLVSTMSIGNQSNLHLIQNLKIKFEPYDWTPRDLLLKGHDIDVPCDL